VTRHDGGRGGDRDTHTTGLSRRGFMVMGGLATAATATDLALAAPASATTPQLVLDFEAGSLGAPLTSYGGASVGSAYAHRGSYGCRLHPTALTNSTAYLEVRKSGFALGRPYATFSMWFRLVTLPSATASYMNLCEIGNTSTATDKSQLTVFFRDDRLVCDFGYGERMDIAPVPVDGGWHQLQAVVHYGATTYTAQVSYDAGPVHTLTSADDKSPQTVSALWIHYPRGAVDYTMDVDDVQLATTTTWPDFLDNSAETTATAPAISFAESFGGGTAGTRPTSQNTAYDQSIGDSGDNSGTVAVVFDAGGVRGQCARFSNTRIVSGTFGFLGKRVGQQKRIFLRRYYYVDALPGYRTSVLLYKYGGTGNGQLGGTHNGSFAIGGTGQGHRFTLVNNNRNTTLSQAVVPTRSWFRVETELDFTGTVGVQTARLFLGANRHGTTPDETLTAHLTGPYTDYVEDGILTSPNAMFQVRIDEAANGTGWIGPVA